MALVEFDAALTWQFGLPAFLPGQGSDLGSLIVPDSPAWTVA